MAVSSDKLRRRIADRIAELAALLYFDERKPAPKSPEPVDASLSRMLRRLKVKPASFDGAWPDVRDKLTRHAKKICNVEPRCGDCPFVSFCKVGQRRVRRDDRFAVVDIFGGAGGLGCGFRKAGFRVALAVEHDRDAAQTYRLNNPGTPVFEVDAARVSASWLRAVAGRRPHVICAGPPCQSFSAAGHRRDHDPRHDLFRHVIDLAHDVDPDIVVIENVPGVARKLKHDKNYRDIITSELGRRFETEVLLLNAADYGVPQIRKRYIFIGRRRGSAPIGEPRKTHSIESRSSRTRTPTVLDALSGLPQRRHGCKKDWFKGRDGGVIHNLTTMTHSKRVIARIRKIKGGEGPISYRRMPKTFARTIIAGHRALPVHPTRHRTMSTREAACVQSFPKNYIFVGSPANQPLQVANAVPPLLGAAIARAVRRHLQAKR